VDRNAALVALSTMPRDQIARALRGCIKNTKQRERALELAVVLHLRESYDDAKKYLEVAPRKVAGLGLLTCERSIVDSLAERWSTADVDGPMFAGLQSAFTSCGVDLAALEPFRKAALAEGDKRRAEAAHKILEFQLGREINPATDLKESDVRELWDDWMKTDRDDGRYFPCAGISVVVTRGWEVIQGDIRGIGANCILDELSQIRFSSKAPLLLDKGPFTYRLWIKASEDFEGWCGFVLKDKGGEFHVGASIKEGELAIPRDTSGVIQTEVKADTWLKLEWTFKERPGAGGFVMQCSLDEKILDTSGTIVGGAPISFVAANNEGRIAIGGMDYLRN
jgi:hypothetical protein